MAGNETCVSHFSHVTSVNSVPGSIAHCNFAFAHVGTCSRVFSGTTSKLGPSRHAVSEPLAAPQVAMQPAKTGRGSGLER